MLMKNFVFIAYTALFVGCVTGLVDSQLIPEFVTKAVLSAFFGSSALLFGFAAWEELTYYNNKRRR